MWQTLYDRITKAQAAAATPAVPREGTTVRHPPASDEPRCPHCTGVRLVATSDPARLRCVWCTRSFDRAAVAA